MKHKLRISTGPNEGLTLVEIMLVIVVVGIIAGITIPNFSGYLQRTKLTGARNEMMADIQYARSLAIARRTTIAMQFTAGQYQIVRTADGQVFRTRNAPDGISFASTGDPNFYAWGLADPVTITLDGISTDSNLTLLANGMVTHD